MGLILFDIQLVLVTLVDKIVTIFILVQKIAEKISIMIDSVNYQRMHSFDAEVCTDVII